MNVTTHNDRLLTNLLANLGNTRADAVAKINNAARNASSLQELREAIEIFTAHMHRIEGLYEEAYRKAERH